MDIVDGTRVRCSPAHLVEVAAHNTAEAEDLERLRGVVIGAPSVSMSGPGHICRVDWDTGGMSVMRTWALEVDREVA